MRYAIYFTPQQDDPLTRLAAQWLGRDVFADGPSPHTPQQAFAEEDWLALTAEPRRYGFHATLKAPFELASGRTGAELMEAFEQFAASHTAFDIPEIVVAALGPFFALVPAAHCPPLQTLADDTVRGFERFRAPLSQADIARRRPETLSENQRDHLYKWGYPYVMEDFRFHMTLTGKVPQARQAEVRSVLDATFAPVTGRSLAISGLALFTEDTRGAPFTVRRWLPLGRP